MSKKYVVRVCETEYVDRALDAARRHRRGERQWRCRECSKWRWPDERCCDGGMLIAHTESIRDRRTYAGPVVT